MITSMLKPALFLLVALVTFNACSNPMKLMEKGEFDEAIQASVKKMAGKKNKKTKHVKALEESFARVTSTDMRQIQLLKKEGREENWVKINELARRIQRRQSIIEPFLPIYSEDGYKADFKFVRIEDLALESKEKAAAYYYSEGKRWMAQAERGDKSAARKAWDQFSSIGQYYPQYKDEKEWMKRAKDLGTTYVLFKMQNNSATILPRDFEREIMRMDLRGMNSEWRSVHLNPSNGIDYDYTVTMYLTHISSTPDLVKETEYVDDMEIEDGWEYVLDKNGNVKKDSSGNDIKVPKKVLIKAYVLETFQNKAVHVEGRLEFFDNKLREIVKSETLAADTVFENYAATYRGDQRALSEESKRKIGHHPVPFPSSESLLLQAAESLKPIIKEKINRSRAIS
jgi:hypothetical protein